MTFTLAKGKRIYGGHIVPRSLRKILGRVVDAHPQIGPLHLCADHFLCVIADCTTKR